MPTFSLYPNISSPPVIPTRQHPVLPPGAQVYKFSMFALATSATISYPPTDKTSVISLLHLYPRRMGTRRTISRGTTASPPS